MYNVVKTHICADVKTSCRITCWLCFDYQTDTKGFHQELRGWRSSVHSCFEVSTGQSQWSFKKKKKRNMSALGWQGKDHAHSRLAELFELESTENLFSHSSPKQSCSLLWFCITCIVTARCLLYSTARRHVRIWMFKKTVRVLVQASIWPVTSFYLFIF